MVKTRKNRKYKGGGWWPFNTHVECNKLDEMIYDKNGNSKPITTENMPDIQTAINSCKKENLKKSPDKWSKLAYIASTKYNEKYNELMQTNTGGKRKTKKTRKTQKKSKKSRKY